LKRRFAILFVCTGNTCRSPLAEVMMKARLKQANIADVNVSSAGTAAFEGAHAAADARAVARRMGLRLGGFRSHPLTQLRIRRADLVLTMTAYQKRMITERWPEAARKTFVISELSGSGRGAITDPIGKSETVYERCAADLADEITRLVPKVRRMLKARGRKR
jgi:protein-tyrosine-phosphatase